MPHGRLFSVYDLSLLWNLSTDTIRRIFLHEPGVIIISKQRRGTRTYKTLRIPETVALRVYRRLGGTA